MEKIARFPGEEKSVESYHVSGCHVVGVFKGHKIRGNRTERF